MYNGNLRNEAQAAPAMVSGKAGRISKADKDAAAGLIAAARPALIHMTIHITRKATGMVETFNLVGTAGPSPKETQ